MTLRRSFLMLAVLTVSNSALAQHGHERGGRGGATAPHNGQPHRGQAQHPHMMALEQHHEHMMQQWWYEQLMLNEMMGARGARGHRNAQAQPGSSRPQAGTGEQQPGGNRARRGATESAADTNQRPFDASQQPLTQERVRKTKQSSSASKHAERAKDPLSQNRRPRNETSNNTLPLAADRPTVSILRMVHTKLQRVDHDYQGHRLDAMSHVAAAIRHLHPSFLLSSSDSAGLANLTQAQSDRILRDAMAQLQKVQSSLRSGANEADDHRRAHASVADAIHELHTALSVN